MVTEPESMDNLIYFTNRTLGDKGKIISWVYKQNCPACGKVKIGKPKDEKTGKTKIRAKEYVCPECGHTVEKEEYEATLTAEAKYTCPECSKEGEASTLFKRKTIDGVKTLRFQCQHCDANLDVTKKMKEKKNKAKPDVD